MEFSYPGVEKREGEYWLGSRKVRPYMDVFAPATLTTSSQVENKRHEVRRKYLRSLAPDVREDYVRACWAMQGYIDNVDIFNFQGMG